MTSLQPSPQDAAQELLERRKARASLIDFTRYTKPDYQAAECHRLIAAGFEAVERGDCRRLIIEAPPQHGKSELVSRRGPAWYLGRHPDSRVVNASYNSEFATDIGRDVRNIVGDPEFRNVFPDVTLSADSTAANRWHTNKGGLYVSVGVEGALTGRGFNLGGIDDPFKDRADADSETKRDAVWAWYVSVFLTRQAKDAAIILTNTRWHEDDLTGRILAKAQQTGEHWEVIKLPAIKDGKALWPEGKPLEMLQMLRATLPARDWLSLYQQTPTADEGTYFKAEWFRRYNDVPDSLNIYITGDFAITDDADADYTEIAVWGVDTKSNIYALDWWTGQKDPAEWCDRLLDLVQRWGPQFFVGERANIEKTVVPFLNQRMRDRNIYCATEFVSAAGNKEAKARSFQAIQSLGQVYWPHTDWAERSIDQMLRFPAAKNDDVVDACSVLGRYLTHVWQSTPRPGPKMTLEQAWEPKLTFGDIMR